MGGRYLRELAEQVFARENGRCFYCDQTVSLEARPWLMEDHAYACEQRAATFDHIVPVSRGGSDEINNGVCACIVCNNERRDLPAPLFLFRKLQQLGLIAKAA